MGRWVAFFVFTFIMGTLISGVVDSQSVYAVTYLDGAVTETDTTITVDTTANFPSSGAPASGRRFYVGDEVIQYTTFTGTAFTGCTRGVTDPKIQAQTVAAAHSDNTKVQSLAAKTISGVGGINLITSGVSFGSLAAYVVTGTALKDIMKTLSWDYPWFQGSLIYARLPLLALSAGFLWALAMIFIALAQGILSLV